MGNISIRFKHIMSTPTTKRMAIAIPAFIVMDIVRAWSGVGESLLISIFLGILAYYLADGIINGWLITALFGYDKKP